jgi:tetratricopeptide (TPR) repeat protein
MPIALIIALLLGGGTSAVAETSLPGDLTYQIKVNVNENIRSMLAISTESQTKWDARRVEKRIEEIEKLLEKKELDEKKTLEVEARLDAQVKRFEDGIKKLSDKKQYGAAAEINSNFGASINAHQDILIKLEEKDASLAARIRPIFSKLNLYTNSSETSRVKIESDISANNGPEMQVSAEGKMKSAQNKIDEVSKFLENKKSSVSTEVYTSASTKLDIAKQAVVEGNTYISAKNYSSAFSSFQRASRLAQEAKLALNSGINIKIDAGIKIEDNKDSGKTENSKDERSSENNVEIDMKGGTDARSEGTETESKTNIQIKVGL